MDDSHKTRDLATSVPESWAAFARYKEVLSQTSDSAEKLQESQKKLGEVFKAVGKEVPQLSGAMEALEGVMSSGAAGAVQALAEAWRIYHERLQAATEAFSDVALPDLASGITQAKQLAERWNGVADAVKNANNEFESVEKRNERNKSADEKDHDNRKNTIALEKEQALAKLDLSKGDMTKAEYKLTKAGIENEYAEKESAEEQRYGQQKLQRKEAYQSELAAKAKSDAAKADAMKLPKTQEEFDSQIKALEESANTFGATATKHKKNANEVRETQVEAEDGVMGSIRAIPGALKSQLVYGWGTKGGDIIKGQDKMAKDAAEKQAAILKQIADRTKAWHEKQYFQNSATGEAGESMTAYNELYSKGGERDQFQDESNNRRTQLQAKEQINVIHAVAEATEGGQKVQEALDVVHQAHLSTYGAFQQKLLDQASDILKLQAQMYHIQSTGLK